MHHFQLYPLDQVVHVLFHHPTVKNVKFNKIEEKVWIGKLVLMQEVCHILIMKLLVVILRLEIVLKEDLLLMQRRKNMLLMEEKLNIQY